MSEFRKIPGYELYEISKEGEIRNARTFKVLKPRLNQAGHPVVNLYQDKKRKCISMAHLVALAWLPNVQNYKYVDHLDGDKLNIHAHNLMWVSAPTSMCRKVLNIDTGQVFHSAREAAASVFVHESCLRKCCEGISSMSGGYKWKYL